MKSGEIISGQEYISTSDGRTRRIISSDKDSVVFVCIDCSTIGINKEATMSYIEFHRCVKNKIFVLTKEAKVVVEKKIEKTEVKKSEIKAPKKEPIKTTLF